MHTILIAVEFLHARTLFVQLAQLLQQRLVLAIYHCCPRLPPKQ